MAAGSAPVVNAASTGCAIPTTKRSFLTFGDLGWYYRAPGGGFEGESLSWAQRGDPTIVSPSHNFDLYFGITGDHALSLPEDSRVTTPKLCVSPATPHMRFLARAAGGSEEWEELEVEVRIYEGDKDEGSDRWDVVDTTVTDVLPSDHRRWRPSEKISLEVDRLQRGETGYVDLRFSSDGDWKMDDVLIDPYRRG